MLEVRGVGVHYGRILALDAVSIEVGAGEIVALVGSNGAGKSTLVNAISGLVRTTNGEISFDGRRTDTLSSMEIVRAGIVQVAEGRQLFPALTIEENLRMGAFTVCDKETVQASIEETYSVFPVLGKRRSAYAQTLSGGEQQMLAIGRALMSRPKMLIFDEPSLGLAPMVVEKIFGFILELNKKGMPILLIEQNVQLSLGISHRGYVLERGRIVLAGESKKLLRDPHVEAAYLGI